MKQKLIALIVALISVGWLVPLWLAVSSYLAFWQSEGLPLLHGQNPLNSFPYLAFVRSCFQFSMCWLFVVLLFWSYIGYLAINRRQSA